MFGIIYTPTEGDAIQNYSRLFRRPEGCFLNIEDQEEDRIDECLSNFNGDKEIDYIVVSDGEEVTCNNCPVSSFQLLCKSDIFSPLDPRNWRPRRGCCLDFSGKACHNDVVCWNPSIEATPCSIGLWNKCRSLQYSFRIVPYLTQNYHTAERGIAQ